MHATPTATPAPPSTRLKNWLARPDYILALATTALVIFLHVCLTPNVGGLWRDEANTVNLATLPTLGAILEHLDNDSFPLLFAGIVRYWSKFFGSGDDSLRVLGLGIGLGGVAAIWLNARLFGLKFPFWSLLLIGANPLVIRYGDSVRAYGLGMMFLLLMVGTVWRLSQSPTLRNFLLATAISVLAVHSIYYNAVLLFALGVGGCVSALFGKRWLAAGAVLGVGAIAAVTMLPYLPKLLHASNWNFLVQYPFTVPFMWTRIMELFGSPHWAGLIFWPCLVAIALAIAATTLCRRERAERRDLVIFCLVSLLVGIVAYTAFLKLLSYYTQVWYYMALATFIAACIDPLLYPAESRVWIWMRGAGAGIFLIANTATASKIVALRHTNIDLAVKSIQAMAAPEDFIILTRWECGVTMDRYYKGPAAWTTIPPLVDFHFQDYGPILAQMREEAPLQPVFEKVEQTLRGGHQVWILGSILLPRPGQATPVLKRVTDADPSWRGSPAFYQMWVAQFSEMIMAHQTQIKSVPLSPEDRAPFEELPLRVVAGWR